MQFFDAGNFAIQITLDLILRITQSFHHAAVAQREHFPAKTLVVALPQGTMRIAQLRIVFHHRVDLFVRRLQPCAVIFHIFVAEITHPLRLLHTDAEQQRRIAAFQRIAALHRFNGALAAIDDLLEAIVALPNDIFYNTGIATYIWVLSNKKADHRKGKVQLINANGLFEKRRKALGNKRNDISEEQIVEITRIYGDFIENDISKIFSNEEFGYSKIVVERPLKDETGKPILKKGKPQPDSALRDTENVPLTEDIEEYFAREVLPFAPDAWIDESKTKVGYEISFTRYFYKYEAPKPSAEIMAEILELEKELDGSLGEIFQ